MKGIVVTPYDEIYIEDFSEPKYKTVGDAVGGFIEIVRPTGLPKPYAMVVNEEGLIHGLPYNRVGSLLYGTHIHGNPILGNIVILKEGFTEEGPDFVDMEKEELDTMFKSLCGFILTPLEEQ